MYNDRLVYKVAIWVFFGISLWTEKVALRLPSVLLGIHFVSGCGWSLTIANVS